MDEKLAKLVEDWMAFRDEKNDAPIWFEKYVILDQTFLWVTILVCERVILDENVAILVAIFTK